jgi:hypothetical protein
MRSLSKDVWILIGLLAILIVAGVLSKGREEASREFEILPRRTTYSARPGGTKALHETLRALDYRVQRNTHDLSEDIPNGALFVISPETPLAQDELDALRRWVERGNLLIMAYNQPPVVEDMGKEPRVKSAGPVIPSFLSPGVRSVGITGYDRIDVSEPIFQRKRESMPLGGMKHKPERHTADRQSARPVIPLFADGPGTVVAFSSYGRGSVILLADGWPLSNQGISRNGNFRMVLNALQRRDPDRKPTVTFDEFHHGYGTGKGIMSLIDTPARLGLLVIALAFLLLFFSASRRFGRPIPLVEGARQRGEYLASIASLLRKARAHDLVRRELGQRFLADAAMAVGVEPGSHVEVILVAAHKLHPDKINALTELCHAATSGEGVEDEAATLAMARRWHKMREDLTK